ncbi:ABC transporter permease [Geoalkalibacter sp.]|uniref:ABC transporter permease n=1 Tax=Geoalkalibacter sp. TaxID=3041440 RepID=UPI00272E50D2|nr:ABC transporter permease [Geoalkalibacter sp.]
MRALQRKLWRELWQLRSQALAIAVVIAGGVATLVMSLATLDALRAGRDAYYRDYRFAEVFASLKRAPRDLLPRVAALGGVREVESRVVAAARLEVEGFGDPATALLTSLPDGRNAELNRLFLRLGRLPEAGRDAEAVISEPFAEAHGLRPGDALTAVINGRRQELRIVGIGLSPEHVYQLKPGDLFPDPLRYALVWMNRAPLEAALDMEGAFNSLVLTLEPDARQGEVLAALDRLLTPYGSTGAIGRADQTSHNYLEAEFAQLATMARVFPVIFLGVAAFLLHVVTARLIATQRDQIAILKAFGYGNPAVGGHYAQLVLWMTAGGLLLGIGGGYVFGQALTRLYMDYFRFPLLDFRLGPRELAIAALVTLGAALLGTLGAVRRAVCLPPAEAMRPEPPAHFRPTLVERFGLQPYLSQPLRMILREFERRPLKALLSVVGIALSCAILTVGTFQQGAVTYMLAVQFTLAQRYDLAVSFVEPTSRRVLHELAALPGVRQVEPLRSAAVEVRHGHRRFRTSLQGILPDGDLQRVLDARLQVLAPPRQGVVLTDFLAEILAVEPGGRIQVEILEGRRRSLELWVEGLVSEYVGVAAYMDLETLDRLLGEGQALSGALLALEPGARDGVVARLRESPRVAAIGDRLAAMRSFYETLDRTVLVFSFISTLLAASIAFGVVYNSARIALSERSRELASLRVLGLRRGEVSAILLGELTLLTLAGIPLGFVVGRFLCWYLTLGMRSDFYRVPLVLEPATYAFAALVVAASAVVSGLIVHRRLQHLDLVAVLKTRE